MFKKLVTITIVLCMILSVTPVLAETETTISGGVVCVTDAGNYDAEITIANPASGNILVVAFYDKGVLSGFACKPLADTSEAVTVTVEAEKVDSATAFIWESSETLVPVCKSKPIAVPATMDFKVKTQDAVISGEHYNVIIAPEIQDGNVTLKNATINGDLTILGGGSHSVHLEECSVVGKVVINKTGGEVPRLHLMSTNLRVVEVKQPAMIETTGQASLVDKVVASAPVTVDSEAVQKVEIPETTYGAVSVIVKGTEPVDIEVNSANNVNVTGSNVTISTALETAPPNITVDGTPVSHIHKWGEPTTTPATCDEDGTNVYACIANGCDATKTEILSKLAHEFGKWQKLDDTYHERICFNNINHAEQEKHNWKSGAVIKEPTEGSDGLQTFTCEVCGGAKTETIRFSKIVFEEKYDDLEVGLSQYDYEKYTLEVLDSYGNKAKRIQLLKSYDGLSVVNTLPMLESGTETYSLVIYAVDNSNQIIREVARLNNAYQVTVSGEPISYNMAFHSPVTGQHILTCTANKTLETVAMCYEWRRDGDKSFSTQYSYTSSIGSGDQEYFRYEIEDGYSVNARAITSLSYDGKTVKATITPPSKKIYQKNAATNLRFESYGSGLYCLAWDGADATGPDGTYYQVLATADGGITWNALGDAYYENRYPMFFDVPTSYNGLKVLTFINKQLVGEAVALDLSVTARATSSSAVSATFTKQSSGGYQADFSGILAKTYFNFYLASSRDAQDAKKVYSGMSSTSGTGTTTITNSAQIQQIESGYYLVKEFRNYRLTDMDKTLSYQIVTRGTWQSCN